MPNVRYETRGGQLLKIVSSDEVFSVPTGPAKLGPPSVSVSVQSSAGKGGTQRKPTAERKPVPADLPEAAPMRPLISTDAPELHKSCFLLGYCSVTGGTYSAGRSGPEQIAPGGFRELLRGDPDIVGLFSHSWQDYFASTRGESLFLHEDDYGLLVGVLPNSVKARQVARLVRLGHATEMSICRKRRQSERVYLGPAGYEHRVRRASLTEVSICEKAANPATAVECYCQGDRPRVDVLAERALIAREQQTAGIPHSFRGDALLRIRQERGRLRLNRLATTVMANGFFMLSQTRQRELLKGAMASFR